MRWSVNIFKISFNPKYTVLLCLWAVIFIKINKTLENDQSDNIFSKIKK